MSNYFVTCIDAGKVWYMAGPYKTHQEALEAVDTARTIGVKNNPWAWFYSWGTVSSDRTEPGSITRAGLMGVAA
jgi:hypothetical protein